MTTEKKLPSVRLTVRDRDWHPGLPVVFYEKDGEVFCEPEYRFLPDTDTSAFRVVIDLHSGSYKKFDIVPPLRDDIGVDSLVCVREGSEG